MTGQLKHSLHKVAQVACSRPWVFINSVIFVIYMCGTPKIKSTPNMADSENEPTKKKI